MHVACLESAGWVGHTPELHDLGVIIQHILSLGAQNRISTPTSWMCLGATKITSRLLSAKRKTRAICAACST